MGKYHKLMSDPWTTHGWVIAVNPWTAYGQEIRTKLLGDPDGQWATYGNNYEYKIMGVTNGRLMSQHYNR